jgi:hypothetical protein
LVEFYICDCIRYGPNRLRGWWSDGVVHLEIAETIPNHFKLIGVTWIDSHGMSPFEIDVELNTSNDTYFAKTVFRIGTVGDCGEPVLASPNLAPIRVLQTRPRYNRDWAMAIELTAPRENTTEQ